MSARLALLSFVMLACAGTGPMGNSIPDESRFVKEWNRYLGLEDSKALVLAGDVEGRFVFGYAYDLPDAESAEERAHLECEARRGVRNIQAPCLTYAVGDERVEPPAP